MFSVCIIGAGRIAEEHIKAFQSVKGVVVSGLLSRTKSKALRMAQLYNIPIVARDVEDLHSKTNADLVVISVTIDSTKEMIESCWQYDWKVLTEKPLGLNYSEAKSLSQTAKLLKKDCFVAFNRRHFSSVDWVKSQIAEQSGPLFVSAVGQENLIEVGEMGFSKEIVQNWMFANSIHVIDLILFFVDSPVKSIKTLTPFSKNTSPLVVSAFLEFENGSNCIYQCNWNMQGPWGVSIATKGMRWEILPLENAYMQTTEDRSKIYMPNAKSDVEFKPGFKMQAERAVAASQGARKFEANLLDGLETMRVIHCIFFGD